MRKLQQAMLLVLVFLLASEPTLAMAQEFAPKHEAIHFVSFVRRVGADMLLKLGFDEGSALVGRVLNLGVDLSDEAAEGLGRVAKTLNGEDLTKFMNTLGNTCFIGNIKLSAKLAIPSQRAGSVCNPEFVQKVLTSFGKFDDATVAAVQKLGQKIEPDDLVSLLSKYASNPNDLTHVKSIFEGLEKALSNPRFKVEALDLAKSADIADAPFLGKYFDEISSINLANISVKQGFNVSKKAQEIGVNIHVAGRWADTGAEKIFRDGANIEAANLFVNYKTNPEIIPAWAQNFITDGYPEDEVLDFASRYEIAKYYQDVKGFEIDWYQVKSSSGGSEVDVFVGGALPDPIDPFLEFMRNNFGVSTVDVYNKIQLRPWMIGRSPNPAINIPPGTIDFGADGLISHELLP